MVRLLLVLTAVAFGATPSAASALDFGGGGVPAIFQETAGPPTNVVSLRVAPARRSGRVYFHVRTRCVGGVARGLTLSRPVRISAGGVLSAKGRVRHRDSLGQMRVSTYELRGTLDATKAAGTISARTAIRESGRKDLLRCTSGGGVPFALRQSHRPGGPPAAGAAGVPYYGVVAQDGLSRPNPFALRVSEDGTRVATALFRVQLTCRTGRPEFVNFTPAARLAADGRFSRTETFNEKFTNGVERFRVRVTGAFRTDGVAGSVEITSKFTTKTGLVGDVCRSGRLTFSAVQ